MKKFHIRKSHYYIVGAFAVLALSFGVGILARQKPTPKYALPDAPDDTNAFLAALPPQNSYETLGAAKPTGGFLPDPKVNKNKPFGKFINGKRTEPVSSVMQTEQGAMLIDKQGLLSQEEGYPASGKAAELYKGAIPVIGKIIKSEKSFFAKNTKYTALPEKLGLAFNDVSSKQETEDISIVYLNNGFYYILTKEFAAVYYNGPKNDADHYYMKFNFNGEASCVAETVGAGQTCRNLGGDFPMANKKIPSWIEYSLPKNIITMSASAV